MDAISRRSLIAAGAATGVTLAAGVAQAQETSSTAKRLMQPKKMEKKLNDFGVISFNAPAGAEIWFTAIFEPGREGAKVEVTDERPTPNLGLTLEYAIDSPVSGKFDTDGTSVGPSTQMRPFSIRGTLGDKKLIAVGGGVHLGNDGMYYTLYSEDDHFPPPHSNSQNYPAPSVMLVIQPVYPK